MPLETASRCRRRGSSGADPLVSRPAVVNQTAWTGRCFLLARRAEIAQLLLLPWVRPAGVVRHRTLHARTRSLQILIPIVCSTLVPAKVGNR